MSIRNTDINKLNLMRISECLICFLIFSSEKSLAFRTILKSYGESTYLGILYHDEVLYLSHFDSIQMVRVAGAVGGSYPLYCTAPGKALLAFSGEDYIRQYLQMRKFKAYTEHILPKLRRRCNCR